MLQTFTRCRLPERKFARFFTDSCKLLIVGGGTGGITMAAKFSKKLKPHEIILVEPSDLHYYQPIFTLIGGGMKNVNESFAFTKELVPPTVKLIKDSVHTFEPEKNTVRTTHGKEIKYDFMIVALGLTLRYDEINGVNEALTDETSGVCSIYSPQHVANVWKNLQTFQSGNAIFTFPNSPVKCPGAPQKICYIAEDYFTRNGKRENAKIFYNTALPVIFGVDVYAKALWKVAKSRDINVNTSWNLIGVNKRKREAVFENVVDKTETVMTYSLLHVTPPQKTPDSLRNSALVNEMGFLNVNKTNLQHVTYSNIFGIGDCTNTPNSKTMAAIAAQSAVVYDHLLSKMTNRTSTKQYDGYASCPLVTGYNTCILAEFDYNLKPKETFPIRQDRESRLMFFMKKEVMPVLYWQLMLKGHWNGPAFVRKLTHFGFV